MLLGLGYGVSDTTHIRVSDLETLKIWDSGTPSYFLDTGTGTHHNHNILISKYGKLDILTKSNNKTQIRHDYVGDCAN